MDYENKHIGSDSIDELTPLADIHKNAEDPDVPENDNNQSEVGSDTPNIIPDGSETRYFEPEISYYASPDYNFEIDNASLAKSCSTRLHLSLFLYLIIGQGIATLFTLMAALLAPEAMMNGSTSSFSIVLNIVAQYVIAFPVFFLLTRNIDKRKSVNRRKLGADEFLIILLISEAAMLLGALLSNLIGEFFGSVFGATPENSIDTLLSGGDLVLTAVMVCVLAPIFEELMFRKIFIDRLSVFGDKVAIILSAVAFGFFHGNIYQIIYATAVGLIFGYVYTQTGKIHHTMILHSALNFLGGVLPMLLAPLEQNMREAEEFFAANGYYQDEGAYIINGIILSAFSIFEILLLLGGIAAFIVVLAMRKIKIRSDKEIEVSGKALTKAVTMNVGFILAYALCLVLTILTVFVM